MLHFAAEQAEQERIARAVIDTDDTAWRLKHTDADCVSCGTSTTYSSSVGNAHTTLILKDRPVTDDGVRYKQPRNLSPRQAPLSAEISETANRHGTSVTVSKTGAGTPSSPAKDLVRACTDSDTQAPLADNTYSHQTLEVFDGISADTDGTSTPSLLPYIPPSTSTSAIPAVRNACSGLVSISSGDDNITCPGSMIADHDLEKKKLPCRPLKLVGGLDISFVKGTSENACATLVVLDFPSLETVYEAHERVTLAHPYISGFLAFREVGFF